MNNCVCRKCGLEAMSKCLASRNVFPDWGDKNLACLIEQTCTGLEVETDEYWLTASIGWKFTADNWENGKMVGKRSPNDAMDLMLTRLERFAELPREQQRMVLCVHEWTYKDGCGPTI